jgi:hypothetical protein
MSDTVEYWKTAHKSELEFANEYHANWQRAEEINAVLLEACKAAKQLLDALRMDNNVGEILTDQERELYRAIDERITATIAKAEADQ